MKRLLKSAAIILMAFLLCCSGMMLKTKAEDNITTDLAIWGGVVRVGKEMELDCYIEPWEARESLIWKSENESIATVKDGIVTGVSVGKTRITAETTDGSGLSSSCEVRVIDVDGDAYAVRTDDGDFIFLRSNDDYTWNMTSITDIKGKVYTGKIYPNVESGGYPSWNNDEKVKKVYVAEGSEIYVNDMQNFFYNFSNMTEADLSGFHTEEVERFDHLFASCKSLQKLDISDIVMSEESYAHNIFGQCNSLVEIVLGPEIKCWSVFYYLPFGKWTNGTVSMTGEELSGQYPEHASEWAGTWTRKIVPATSIKYEHEENQLYPNYGETPRLIIEPEDGTPVLEYESSDPSIAEVTASGEVIGRSVGTATITARTVDGTNLTATCVYHIIEKPEPVYLQRFKFTKKEYEVPVNAYLRLEYEVTPEDAEIVDLFWESSDESIADVYGGVVYPKNIGTVTITGRNGDGTIKDTCTVKITERVEYENYVWRVYGDNRYKTSMAIAEAYRDWFTDGKVDNVILACGTNFADALAGSYLSAVKYAPIIIINDDNIDRVKNYVKESVEPDGTVYILGGNVAVSEKVEKEMKKVFKNVKRLAGSNRYGTNLEILKEAGMNADSILVATGNNFADSLSASAAGLPMLLVKDSLNSDQKAFLEKNKGKKLYILGGTSAVSSAVEKELKKYGEVKRVAGASRFETSIEIAKTFFDEPYYAMFAYSNDYPDGLCGGPIGVILGSPLILTRSDKLTEATKYCKDMGIVEAIVFGGEARLTNNDVKKLLNQKSLHFEERKYEGK